jgi:hypothetical protein
MAQSHHKNHIPKKSIPNPKAPNSVVAQLRVLTQLNLVNKDNAATQQDQPLRWEVWRAA